jgi:hypothetical protein
MHPGDAKGGIVMDQDREDPGKQEPVTPEGAHGEQFYAILRAIVFYAILRTIV